VCGFPFPPSFKVLDTVTGDYFGHLERKREAREISAKDVQMLFTYLTEAPILLHQISMFSIFGAVVLALGSNSANQLRVYAKTSPSAQLQHFQISDDNEDDDGGHTQQGQANDVHEFDWNIKI